MKLDPWEELSPGFLWVLWGFGAGMSGLPLLVDWMDNGRLTERGVTEAVSMAALLAGIVGFAAGMRILILDQQEESKAEAEIPYLLSKRAAL